VVRKLRRGTVLPEQEKLLRRALDNR